MIHHRRCWTAVGWWACVGPLTVCDAPSRLVAIDGCERRHVVRSAPSRPSGRCRPGWLVGCLIFEQVSAGFSSVVFRWRRLIDLSDFLSRCLSSFYNGTSACFYRNKLLISTETSWIFWFIIEFPWFYRQSAASAVFIDGCHCVGYAVLNIIMLRLHLGRRLVFSVNFWLKSL